MKEDHWMWRKSSALAFNPVFLHCNFSHIPVKHNDNKTAFDRNVGEITVKKNGVQSKSRRLSSFLICCIRILFNPWKWQNAVGIAVKLILISASLSSTIQLYHSRQQSYSNSPRKLVSVEYSKEAEILDTLLTTSKMPLDVFCGRG